ncbi:LytTR family transcriptional regulator [Eubacteriales bacterium OttesenSCG-928-K08]|nr:LytTR family transcriptional regulator [Eubacteriales bacterium OttesenSCG-928-K08]
MRIRIELVEDEAQEEVVIRCKEVNDQIQRLGRYIQEVGAQAMRIVFYSEGGEFFFPIDDVYFFETNDENVFAHTAKESYQVKYRLYELEQVLPRQFVRVSKSTILNARHVFSVQRNLTASSLVQFQSSHKQVFVSRHYFKALRQRLDERSILL